MPRPLRESETSPLTSRVGAACGGLLQSRYSGLRRRRRRRRGKACAWGIRAYLEDPVCPLVFELHGDVALLPLIDVAAVVLDQIYQP